VTAPWGRQGLTTRCRRAILAAVAVAASLVAVGNSRAAVQPGDCAWFTKADPDKVNIAWPDEGAQYWAANFAIPPGVDMQISGRFPLARYMSFHIYEGSVPIDSITDYQIAPSVGRNPFLRHAVRADRGTYTIHVVAAAPPSTMSARKPNTLYAGRGLNGEPMVTGIVLYRIYLPDHDPQGSAPLPQVSYVVGGQGADVRVPLSCSMVRDSDNSGSANEAVKQASWPLPAPGIAAQPPTWGLARSGKTANQVGPETVYTGNPFFANFDNTYLSLLVGRNTADLVAVRGKAPTFPDTADAKVMGTGQVRYWSICSNDFPTTRYVACLADRNVKLDPDGDFTVVVSDPQHKPSLGPYDNWLPAGPYEDYFLLYRHMLPDPSFTGAIQRVPDAQHIASSMGVYFPTPVACSTAQFDKDRCGLPG